MQRLAALLILVVLAGTGVAVGAGAVDVGAVGVGADDPTAGAPGPAPDASDPAAVADDALVQVDGAGDANASEEGDLELHHLDVGQADATLVVTPAGEKILIDTGDWRQDGSEVLAYLRSAGVGRIDHLVATHGHADHVGGHAAVIEHFETAGDGIGATYDSGVPHDSLTYEGYLDAVDEHDVDLFTVEAGDELPLDDDAVSVRVVNPPAGEQGDDLHDNSVSLLLEFGEFGYVTTGDAEADVEARLVEEWADDLDADVYQAGHHGSATSSSAAFLDAVDPEVAVISSDYDSQYGHPDDDVLETFGDRGLETYWTGVHGHVVVTTDGEAVDVETDEAFSTDPADLLAETPDDGESGDGDHGEAAGGTEGTNGAGTPCGSASVSRVGFDGPGAPIAG